MKASDRAWRALILRIESISFGLNRWIGIAQYADYRRYLSGTRESLFAECDTIEQDLFGYLQPPQRAGDPKAGSPSPSDDPARYGAFTVDRSRARLETLSFPSPIPSGIAANDTVAVHRFPALGPAEGTILFHHPAFRRGLGWIEWFTRPLRARFDVVAMASPFHLSRTPLGTYSGERFINPNPVHLYEGMRQWMADNQALVGILELEAAQGRRGSAPVALVGYSLGAYLSALYSQFDPRLPVVAICPTNDYAAVVFEGAMMPSLRRCVEAAGITRADWDRLTGPLRLDQHAPRFPAERMLLISAEYDTVESFASIERFHAALRPRRAILLPSGHSTTAILYRRRIMRETLAFIDELRAPKA